MRFDVHHHIEPSPEVRRWFDEISRKVDLTNQRINQMAVDTSKILAEVSRERTELAGWKALSAGKDKLIADALAQLKTATDALAAAGTDTAALAKVQADLDQGAADLKNDNDEAAAAISANVAPVAVPPTNPAP